MLCERSTTNSIATPSACTWVIASARMGPARQTTRATIASARSAGMIQRVRWIQVRGAWATSAVDEKEIVAWRRRLAQCHTSSGRVSSRRKNHAVPGLKSIMPPPLPVHWVMWRFHSRSVVPGSMQLFRCQSRVHAGRT